jgi:hypothetical protein
MVFAIVADCNEEQIPVLEAVRCSALFGGSWAVAMWGPEAGFGRVLEEVEAQQHNPTPVHEYERTLYESSLCGVPLVRDSCGDG